MKVTSELGFTYFRTASDTDKPVTIFSRQTAVELRRLAGKRGLDVSTCLRLAQMMDNIIVEGE